MEVVDDLQDAGIAKPFSGFAKGALRPICASQSAPPTRRRTSSGSGSGLRAPSTAHHSCQGQGLGETLLLDAIRRVVRASATLMVYAVIVDAKNDRAVAFYERYGFRAFATEQRRLFLPLETFEKLGL